LIRPIEHECSIWVVGKIACLAALGVSEKDEATLVHTLKENDTRGGYSIFVRSREGDGVHFRTQAPTWREQKLVELNADSPNATTSPNAGSLIEPHFELRDWIGFEIAATQTG
jgi:hypothetical protein